MPSTAISAQGAIIQIATGTGGAKTITAVTQALPGSVTATAHGFNNGDVVVIAGVVGMTQLNGNAYVVSYKTTNTFLLTNTDTTGFTAYSSAGTATPNTYTTIGNARTFQGFDGQATEIDVTNFASTGKEFLLGLYDGGQVTCDFDVDHSDAGQISAYTALTGSTKKSFKVILPSGTTPTLTFNAFVKKFTRNGGVDQPYRGQMTLRISGGYTLS